LLLGGYSPVPFLLLEPLDLHIFLQISPHFLLKKGSISFD